MVQTDDNVTEYSHESGTDGKKLTGSQYQFSSPANASPGLGTKKTFKDNLN